MSLIFVGPLAAILFWVAAAGVPSNLPLNQWPMIETHDAATGYLEDGLLHPINQWAITQPSDTHAAVTTQLNCGARAFDWRPQVDKNGQLIMHHADILVNHPMADALQEIVTWAAEHSSDEDLVMIVVSHCFGTNCMQLAQQALIAAGIASPVYNDCGDLATMTFGQALAKSALPKGGHVMAIANEACAVQNWHPEVTCSGKQSKEGSDELVFGSAANSSGLFYDYTCYSDSDTKAFPVKRMFDYLKEVSSAGPPQNGILYSMQGLWQEDKDSIISGELHFSSLLKDESKSQLNKLLTDAVATGPGGQFPHLNMLEVNNVCDNGPQLLVAMRSYAAAVAADLERALIV